MMEEEPQKSENDHIEDKAEEEDQVISDLSFSEEPVAYRSMNGKIPEKKADSLALVLSNILGSSFTSVRVASTLAYCSACVALTLCMVGVVLGVNHSYVLGIFAFTYGLIGHICSRLVDKIHKQNARNTVFTEL